MKTQIRKTITEEIDVEFPVYYKSSAHYYKGIDETHTIVVTRGYKDNMITVDYRDYLATSMFEEQMGNEEEFNEWFDIAMEKIHKLKNK